MNRLMTIFTIPCSEPECAVRAVGSSVIEAKSKMSSHLLLMHHKMVGFGKLPEPMAEVAEVDEVARSVGRPEPAGQVVMPVVASVGGRVED